MNARARLTARSVAALAAALCACTTPRTQIVARLDTDMSQGPAGTLTGVGVRVTSMDETTPRFEQRFELAIGSDPLRLPASLGLVPADPAANRRVTLEVDALHGDDVLFMRRAIVTFAQGHTLRADVFLADRCRLPENRDCPVGTTCGLTGCELTELPMLPELDQDAGPPVLLDGGPRLDGGARPDGGTPADGGPPPRDAGQDGGGSLDAGTRDAGAAPVDAGPRDAGTSFDPNFLGSIASTSCTGAVSTLPIPPVPEGETLVISVVYRGGTVTPITATDSAGNSYFRAVAATDTDPRLEVLVGHVAVALSGSAVITVNHPSGSGIIVSVDRVRGLSPGPFVGQTNNGGSGTSVTGAITTFEPALIFAAVGTRHRRVAATPAGWLPGSGQIAACGGAFGNLSINTFAMVARSTGSQPFSTTLDTAELWRLGLVALR